MMDFDAALLAAYRREPCRVLPNALWKTLAEIPNTTCSFALDDEGRVTGLQMQREDALLLTWRADRALPQFPDDVWQRMAFALLHADVVDAVPPGVLPSREAYFRLQRSVDCPPDVPLPTAFAFADARVEDEAASIAAFISQCYDTIALTASGVRQWTGLPVFVPALAFWIVDRALDMPVALGVSHWDPRAPEVSLEWVQVHPAYRGRRLGTALVRETLRRAARCATHRVTRYVSLATVSGAVANPYRPEALYRRCGFTGNDIWWVLRR